MSNNNNSPNGRFNFTHNNFGAFQSKNFISKLIEKKL